MDRSSILRASTNFKRRQVATGLSAVFCFRPFRACAGPGEQSCRPCAALVERACRQGFLNVSAISAADALLRAEPSCAHNALVLSTMLSECLGRPEAEKPLENS